MVNWVSGKHAREISFALFSRGRLAAEKDAPIGDRSNFVSSLKSKNDNLVQFYFILKVKKLG